MRVALVLLAMVGATMACTSQEIWDEFNAFRRTYRKAYASNDEIAYRCGVFENNYNEIQRHNAAAARSQDAGYTKEINFFSDLTYEEVKGDFMGFDATLAEQTESARNVQVFQADPRFVAPTSFDWRTQNKVTSVKDQAQCGGCYTFAAAAQLESAYLIKHKLNAADFDIDLSEQQLLECSDEHNNKRCDGGHYYNCYEYLIKKGHGAVQEHHYPYVSGIKDNGYTCSYKHESHVFKIGRYVKVSSGESALIQALVENGPLSVAIDANSDFIQYKSGVYQPASASCSSMALLANHAVLLVGYTADHWIIKNSWGDKWGEGGYIRMARKYKALVGTGNGNVCGIHNAGSYAVLA